jgi:DNA-directed RNA polymerase alpha subunit
MTDKLIFDLYSAVLRLHEGEDDDLLHTAANYLSLKLSPEPPEVVVVLPDLRDVLDKLGKHKNRITKALRANDINTTEALLNKTDYELLWFKNFGDECLKFLRQALGEYNLKLREF